MNSTNSRVPSTEVAKRLRSDRKFCNPVISLFYKFHCLFFVQQKSRLLKKQAGFFEKQVRFIFFFHFDWGSFGRPCFHEPEHSAYLFHSFLCWHSPDLPDFAGVQFFVSLIY
jgi:hypothetical protein